MGNPARKSSARPHAVPTGSTQLNPALKDSSRSNVVQKDRTRSNLVQKDTTESNPALKGGTPSEHPARCTVDEAESRRLGVAHCNRQFAGLTAEQRVAHALERLPAAPVLSSSFGAQAAVMLHLVTRAMPDIPVILIDTGYLFPETYSFVDELNERLQLNLRVYRAKVSPAWQEARYGKRWLDGAAGIDAYNRQNKVEPMQRALDELNAGTWFAGLRRAQSASRADRPFLEWSGDRWKVHPIADWSDRDVYRYLKQHDLPYHPLWDKGYVSIGDHHTTRALHEVDDIEQTRFFGVQRECGLHEMDLSSRGA